MTNWTELPFIDYLNAVDDLLEKRFGITSHDCDIDQVAQAQEDGDTPEQVVNWLAEKHDLVEIPQPKDNRVQQLNDLFRQTFIGGKVVMTQGIASLPDRDKEDVITKVRTFNNFSENNDPYGEHDFGAFTHNGQKVFWKIDYYAPDMMHGSENPADPNQTRRVLTIMLAEEY